MNCECITEVDSKLSEQNLKLVGYAFLMPNLETRFTIKTDWVDSSKAPKGKKKSPPHMFVSYCPFCGKKASKDKNTKAKGETNA